MEGLVLAVGLNIRITLIVKAWSVNRKKMLQSGGEFITEFLILLDLTYWYASASLNLILQSSHLG